METRVQKNMGKKLYIGNIGPNADKATLKALFAMFGKVKEAYILLKF